MNWKRKLKKDFKQLERYKKICKAYNISEEATQDIWNYTMLIRTQYIPIEDIPKHP